MSNFFDQFDEKDGKAEPANYFDRFDAVSADQKVGDGQNTSTLGDLGTDLKRGVQMLPSVATGVADVISGGLTNRRFADDLAQQAGDTTGFQPSKWAEEAKGEYSPDRQAAEAEIDLAWKEGDALDIAGSYASNPAVIAGRVAESAPQMVAGGLAGRGALMAGRAAGVLNVPATAAQAAAQAATAGAIGEGAVVAGSTMDQIDRDVEPQRAAAAALGAGVGTAVLGRAGAAVAQRLGIADVESAIAGGVQRTAAEAPGLGKRLAAGAASEGLVEELPQSVQEQMWQNFAENKSLMEGTGRAAVEGTLAGGVMGAGVNVLPARKPSEQMGIDPKAGPLSAAAATAVDGGPAGTQSPVMAAARQALLAGAPQEQASAPYQPADLQTAVAQQLFRTEIDETNPGALRFFRRDNDLQSWVEVPEKDALSAAQARIQEAEQLGEDPLGMRSPQQLLPEVAGESGAGQVEEVEALPVFEQGETVVWSNKDFDYPVEFLGFEAARGADGRQYARVRVAGREGHVPAAELQAQAEQAPPLPTVEMDSGPQQAEQVQATPTAGDPGYDYRVQKNGRPFKGENDVRLRKAFNDAVAAGEQPVVVKHEGGWAVAVPRAQAEPAAPLALPAPSTVVVDGKGNAQRAPVEPFVEPSARLRPLGGPGMERQAPSASRVDEQAHEAATSPINNLPEPTQAQKEAGNYRKGHTRVAGLDISIENPRGSERAGRRPDGSEWRHIMSDHYGYIRRTEGADGEQVDVYLGQQESSDQVFVVDQVNQGDGSFDEHKVMLGFPDQESAVAAYRSNFDADWKVGTVTAMPMDQFKSWLKGGDLRKPLAAPGPEKQAAAKGPRRRVDRDRDSLLQAVIRLGGIKTEWREDTTGESKGNRNIPGVGALWSDKTGTSIDDMASQLDQYGYLPAGEMDNLGGVPWLQQALRDELAGTRYFAVESAAQQEQLERELQQRYADEQARLEDLREAEYASIEAEHGPEIAAQVRALDDAAKAYDEQVLAEAQQFEDDYEQRQQQLGEIDAALGGSPLDQAGAAARDEQLRQADDGQNREQRTPARLGQGQTGESAGFSLEQQTEASLRDQAAQQQAAQKAEAEAQRQAEQKVQADRDRADFNLTGSDRPADVAEARGQNDMFAPRTRSDTKKIDDFGEKLQGARKFLTFSQRMDDAKSLDVKAVSLSKSWPEPDYQALLADGADPWAVGFLRAARDEIPSKPAKGWKVDRWAEQVTKLRDMATKAVADPDYAAKVKARAGDAAALDKGFLGRVELYERFGHDVSLKGMKLHSSYFSLYHGEKNVTKWLVDGPNEHNRLSNWPVEYAVADTKEAVLEAFAKVHAKMKAKNQEVDVGPKVRFDIFTDRYSKAVFIGKKNGKRVVRMKTFPDVKAAREYLQSSQAELEAQYERMKQLPAVRGEDNAPRVGSDYRNGLDVTPELFSETFGFRGVQFGNYVEGRRRQQDLNDAFDALMDMAGILNIPARAISLNGELGLAFGARGTGGPDPAMAHYESAQVVINLTKSKGAGSLGHEWWHALDNYFSRARGAADGMLSDASYERGVGVRPAIVEAYANINKAINRTQLRQRSEKMDELRTKDYWSTKVEMTARAFESYLIAKLSESGVRSDYLANVVSEQAFTLEDSYPYPTAAEIPDIRAAYDHLFHVIETRQDEAGNVALYRLNTDEPMLRLNPDSAKGIPAFSAKAIARQVQEATGLRAMVVDTEFALPEKVLEQVLRDGAVGRVAGVYYNGQAYLVASNLQSTKHAQEVLLHEVVGHQGVRAVLGNRTAKVMQQIYVDIPAAQRQELEERYAGQLDNLDQLERRITVAEEYVAHLAETNPQHSIIQRLVALIRAALRRVFGATGALRWTDADIVALLADSRRMISSTPGPAASASLPAAAVNYRQTPAAPRPAALPQVEEVDAAEALDDLTGQQGSQAFARSLYRARGTDSPFFQRWFSGSKMADKAGRPIAFYHRSFGEKGLFDDSRLGGKTGTGTAALGHFLARQDVGNVERYGPVVERFFVRMRKPKIISQQQFQAMGDWTDAQVQAYRKTVMDQGHDGLYIQGLGWPVVFEGKNIKALRNSGTFDESDQVRYSLAQDATELFNRYGRRPADLNDPFAEENRRLREQDKTLWSRAKQQFRRQFAPGGLLPEAVFSEKIRRDSEFQAVEFDVRHMAGGLEQAVQADYGTSIDQLPDAQMKPLAEALAGRVDAALPQRTREAVVAMRQYIDTLSGEYIGILQQQVEQNLKDADPALVETINRNMGSYVHRSYRAFDDAKWFEKVPTETLNVARRYLANQYREQGASSQEAVRMADVKVNELLKTGTAYSSMESMIAEGKLGAKDLSVLIKRKEIAPEIRALLGEYIDPRVNFAKSATKMGRLIWNQRFLDRVRDQGMGAFLFEEGDRPAGATEQLAGDQSDTYAPLNGLWTFPEVAQAFRDAMGKEQMSDLYRTVVRFNGMVKYGKTVLSPTTAMRNWQSALFFSLANGHFDLSQMKKSLAAFREQVAQNATGEDLAYLRKLKQLGVVYDTPYAGEMARLLEDARLDELLDGKSGTGLKWLRKINQAAQGFYSFGDDFWKILGFENEKAGLQKAGFSEAEAERMAAERIRNTYPTYSMVGRGIDWLRRFPLMGTFVSFPAEVVRTSVNMLRLTAADLKSTNPELQALGRRRAVGMAMVSAGFYALSAMTAAALGVDDDEEEALRDLAPDWQKNSTFLFTGRDADGKLRYFDMSFLDPYGYWKRPITAMLRDQPWQKAAASGLGDMLAPFLGADITAQAVFEVMANKKGSGGPVFQENGDAVDQTLDIADHLRKALQPGFVSNAERLALAGQGVRREGSGQAYDLRDEVVSLLGWRASTTDARTALHYRAYEFGDALAESRRVLTRELRSQNKVDEGDIRDARDTAEEQYQQAFREMSRLVQAAQTAGMGRAQVMQTLRMSGVSSADVAQLLSGKAPQFRLTPSSMGRAVQQARMVGGEEHATEVAKRFRMAMQL